MKGQVKEELLANEGYDASIAILLSFSAFYDDRPNLEHKFVRVIAIVEEENRTLFCLLWDADSEKARPVKAVR